MAKQRFDVYQEITNQIAEAMEDRTRPWRTPWTGETSGLNFSQTQHRGNVLGH